LVFRSHYEPLVGLSARRLRRVILPLCLLRHTSRQLGPPLHAVRPIAPPYPASIASTLEPDVAPHTAPTPQPAPRVAPMPPRVPRAALTSCFTEPPPLLLAATSAPRTGSFVYHLIIVARDPRSTHPMVTHRAVGVTKPVDRLQLSIAAAPLTLTLVPSSVHSALVDPHWRCTMEKYEANSTWDLVPRLS
jgi:hypothetical protein